MKLHLWNSVLWEEDGHARCPEHKIKLDLIDKYGRNLSQDTGVSPPHIAFVCPQDQKRFDIKSQSFWNEQRHFLETLDALNYSDAEIVNLDGYQVPIAITRPAKKDPVYWVEARINDTERGKQLVVYAGKRGASDKAQIFIDTENDKITFDQNNIHPNDIFTKIIGDFASGKKSILENVAELD